MGSRQSHAHQYLPVSAEELQTAARANLAGLGWRNPKALLSWKRFDLPAKYLYIYFRERGVSASLRDHVYSTHLRIWNGFSEKAPAKSGFESFRDQFDLVIESTRLSTGRGLHSVVPLACDGHPVNGAHRIASALYYDKLVLSALLDIDEEYAIYDYRFFRAAASRLGASLDNEFDAMALCYARLKPEARIITLFEPPENSSEIYKIVRSFTPIIYERDHTFSPRGRTNLISEIYDGEPWVGGPHNNFMGAQEKAARCFNETGCARFILVDELDLEASRKLKSDLRTLLGRGNDSVHINDSYEETLRMAEIGFHTPSVQFFNRARFGLAPQLEKLLPNYVTSTIDCADATCIDGGGVLAAFGIRDCDDIDYVHHKIPEIPNMDGAVNSHNEYARHYSVGLDELIHGAENHFYYKRRKFARLSKVASWKERRGETKDLNDLTLIEEWRHGVE